MRILLAATAAMSILMLSSCKVYPTSLGDKKDAVCAAAKAWISADPAVKSQLAVSLSSAVRQAEQSKPESDRSTAEESVIGAAKKLLDDETAAKATDAARTIEKYC